jgi:hypothetical protein
VTLVPTTPPLSPVHRKPEGRIIINIFFGFDVSENYIIVIVCRMGCLGYQKSIPVRHGKKKHVFQKSNRWAMHLSMLQAISSNICSTLFVCM